MSESMDTSVNNNENILQSNDAYIYKGGEINETDRSKIQRVHVDGSVEVVHDKAFYGCINLQAIEFSLSNHNILREIGEKTFYECHNLSSINFQHTQIETINDHAFRACVKLSTIHFPSTVRHIGASCFQHCYRLKVLDLSHVENLESIEDHAFAHCHALTTITLSPTTSRIGNQSFRSCRALQRIDLRTTCINDIGEGAFESCVNLTSVNFPTATRNIGKTSFSSCEKLSFLDLQTTSVERIGNDAFKYCFGLTTVHFPKTLKYIGTSSFENCTKLEHLNLHETSIEKIGNWAFKCCTDLATVVGISPTNQERLQEIMNDEIFHHDALKLPASLVEIGKDCFSDCPKLKDGFNNNRLHYECDINRGGRRFLHRDYHRHQKNDDDHDDKETANGSVVGKEVHYYSSLWPLILYRVMHEMALPQHSICLNDDYLSLYADANPMQRRAGVVFYLLIHGVTADLQPQQSRNVLQTTATEIRNGINQFILWLDEKKKNGKFMYFRSKESYAP